MTVADKVALQKLIEMCLGAPALQLTKMRLTTNKNESANHAISASLPKHFNFSGTPVFGHRPHELRWRRLDATKT